MKEFNKNKGIHDPLDKIKRDLVRLNRVTGVSEENIKEIKCEIKLLKDEINTINSNFKDVIERTDCSDSAKKNWISSFFK